jgi:DNA-binding SARP family transcriptional activator
MHYQFQILGPVGVLRDGNQLPSGPPKRRAMVTAMLLEPNRPISLPALAAAMWPGLPPTSAMTSVRTHAMALRRMLGDRLQTRAGAY